MSSSFQEKEISIVFHFVCLLLCKPLGREQKSQITNWCLLIRSVLQRILKRDEIGFEMVGRSAVCLANDGLVMTIDVWDRRSVITTPARLTPRWVLVPMVTHCNCIVRRRTCKRGNIMFSRFRCFTSAPKEILVLQSSCVWSQKKAEAKWHFCEDPANERNLQNRE